MNSRYLAVVRTGAKILPERTLSRIATASGGGLWAVLDRGVPADRQHPSERLSTPPAKSLGFIW